MILVVTIFSTWRNLYSIYSTHNTCVYSRETAAIFSINVDKMTVHCVHVLACGRKGKCCNVTLLNVEMSLAFSSHVLYMCTCDKCSTCVWL